MGLMQMLGSKKALSLFESIQRELNALHDTMEEQAENFQAKIISDAALTDEISKLNARFESYVTRSAELTILMSQYFRHEIRAIEESREDLKKSIIEPTPDDLRF